MTIQEMLGVPADAAVIVTRLDVLEWGRTLVFAVTASDQPFELRYTDCREIRWRVYAHANASAATALVSFAAGRDQQRSPAQLLTEHFGLSLFYGGVEIVKV